MILEFSKFIGAVAKCEKFASDMNGKRNILMELVENTFQVSYSDGKKNITERLSGEIEDGDINEQAIIALEDIKSVIDACKGSATIKVDTISIKFDGRDKMTANADKFITRGDEAVRCSHVAKTIKYIKTSDLKGGTILTRFNYSNIFSVMDESADVWDITELKTILAKLSKPKDTKTCFVSAKKNQAYSLTAASVSLVELNENTIGKTLKDSVELKNSFSMAAKTNSFLSDILGMIKCDDEVKLQVLTQEKRFCYMATTDGTVGIMFELAPATRYDVMNLQKYESMDYTMYELAFERDVLSDIVRVTMQAAKDDSVTMKLKEDKDTGEVIAVIDRGDASSSISKLEINCINHEDNGEEKGGDKLLSLAIGMNISVINELLNNCYSDFIVFKMVEVSGSIFLRMCDGYRDGEGEERRFVEQTAHFTVMKKAS